jgi:hypothetical protein
VTAETVPVALRAPWWSRLWVGLFFLADLLTGAWLIVHIPAVAHFVTYWTGQDLESGGKYGAWSGFWGAIQPTLIATGLIVYWRTSCHHRGCWLPARHPSADGSLKLCRFHHPDIRGRKVTAGLIRELHHLGHWRMHNPPEARP